VLKHPFVAFAVSILAVFAPIEGMLGTVLILLFSDLLLGIWAAKHRGEPITSSGLKRTVIKALTYEVALMFAFLGEHYLTSLIPFCKIIGAMISMTELLSILENMNEITNNQVLKGIVAKLQSAASTTKDDKKT
jgi:hypothetical protein